MTHSSGSPTPTEWSFSAIPNSNATVTFTLHGVTLTMDATSHAKLMDDLHFNMSGEDPVQLATGQYQARVIEPRP